MGVFLACITTYHVVTKSWGGVRAFGSGVTVGCDPSYERSQSNLGPFTRLASSHNNWAISLLQNFSFLIFLRIWFHYGIFKIKFTIYFSLLTSFSTPSLSCALLPPITHFPLSCHMWPLLTLSHVSNISICTSVYPHLLA